MSNWNSFSFVSECSRNTERTIPSFLAFFCYLSMAHFIFLSSPPSSKPCRSLPILYFDAWSILGCHLCFSVFFTFIVYIHATKKKYPSQKEDHLSTVVWYHPILSLVTQAWHPITGTIWWPTRPLQPVKDITVWAIGFVVLCLHYSYLITAYHWPSIEATLHRRASPIASNIAMAILTATVLLNS